uniref:WD repeat domain 27 n=1 Tax=Leptobrachium leishanense TaxID=445787 RepID=A0A8C5QDS0_9ANUR
MTANMLVEETFYTPIVSERRFATSTSPASHVQLACTTQYCAFPINGNDVHVWDIKDPNEKTYVLKGHHEPVTAVTFRQAMIPCLLCSASRDYVIVWNLDECKQSVQRGLLPQGLIIGTLLGTVSYLTFHPDGMKVAACAGNQIFILHTEHEDVFAELSGHLAPVTAAEFWEDNLVVSISEDRTFMVWDFDNETLVYQSAVLSAFPLLSMFIDRENNQMVTGCVDGQLRVFSFEKEHQFRCVCHIDLEKEKFKFSRRTEDPKKCEKSDERTSESSKRAVNDKTGEFVIVPGLPVLHMQKWSLPPLENESSFAGVPIRLWISSSTGLLFINITNSSTEAVFDFKDYDGLSIQVAGSCSLSSDGDMKVLCLLTSMFGTQISLLELDTHALMTSQQHDVMNGTMHMDLSVVSRTPLLQTSPLCCEMLKKTANQSTKGSKVLVKDQPLVFHSKVKSSGYSVAPRMKMFTPKTNVKKTTVPPKDKKDFLSGIINNYPLTAHAPSIPQKQISMGKKVTATCSIQYSGDGQKLACGLSDKSLLVFNSTLNGEPAVFTGHDGTVNGLGWSYDRNWLVSSGDDRTVMVWNAKTTEPGLVLGKEIFSKPARFPQFYYMDKFILLSSGAEFQLLRYFLDDCKDEIKRYKKKSSCKTIQTFQMATAKEITGLSSVNDFYSYIVLVAGTDRALEVFDLNVGSRVALIPDVHSKAVHQICQNKGSVFSSQQPEAYNHFVTTAVGDGLKLWDLRNLRCVRRFEGHVNRYQPCGVAISPCGRFIACGSEDRCAYIYEMRSSTYLQKLPGHTESVISVAFNPSSSQVCFLSSCCLGAKCITHGFFCKMFFLSK